MRIAILASTPPGRAAEAVADAPPTRRAFATFGPVDAVLEADADGREGLLEVLDGVNTVPAVTGTETLTEMAGEPSSEPPADGLQALCLLGESKAAGCDAATRLPVRLRKIAGVDDVYPVLGRFDQAVWIVADDLAKIAACADAIAEDDDVVEQTTLVQRPESR